MKGSSCTVVSFLVLQVLYCLIGSFASAHPSGHPSYVLGSEHRTNQFAAPNKRAFDRLEASPFDFGAYAKRYSDDDFDFYRTKKSFDRLENGPFNFGNLKRKRSFDRLDTGVFDFHGFQKRSVSGEQQPAFRPAKPLSIAEIVHQPEPSFLYFAP
ncbi:hypothetical protein M3Y97_00365200 [Aphelenchoides bicaudatus]|nr:hypothetical protein M3Y97_00365200 [Aphelenchoides bicaudatus]